MRTGDSSALHAPTVRRAGAEARGWPASASQPEGLSDVIARAAVPFERAFLPCFTPRGGLATDRLVRRRETRWIGLLTGGNRQAFLDLLALRGLTLADARRGLAEVDVTDPATLPPWAQDVLALFSDAAGAARPEPVPTFALGELADAYSLTLMDAQADAPWTFHRIFEPLLRRGEEHLQAAIARAGAPVEPAAVRRLLASLAQRLSGACTTVLFHIVTLDETIADHPGAAGQPVHRVFFDGNEPVLLQWSRLFQQYPVLARLLAVTHRNWCDAVVELLTRLSADRPRLEATFASGALGALSDCSLSLGDPHDHGRTVGLLTFASGTRVVYKPKDLRVAAAYMELIEQLNAGGIVPQLPTRRLVISDGFAWEEFVTEAPCASADDVRRFYVQMGAHVRLVQLLDGADFTGDNVIAGGAFPALVDLEAILSPRMPVPGNPSASVSFALDQAAESPVRGCLVTAKIVGERGRPAAELGALSPSGECVAPFKQRALRPTESGPALVDIYPEFPPSRSAPWFDGVRARSTDHFDAVVTGYVEMAEHLRRIHGSLAVEQGPLAALRDVEVRCICRDTHIYARMLQSSLTPTRLRDTVERELCLERMWKASFSSPAVVTAEIDALRDLDIPMFASHPGSAHLLMAGKVVAEDFFEGTAASRLADRVRALPASTRERDTEDIESVLFTLSPTTPRRAVGGATTRRAGTPEWSSAAERAGDELLAAAIGPAGDPVWIGASYHPWSDSWRFGTIGPDLFSGTAGVGLVLAELAACTGAARFADAARGALHGTARHLKASRLQFLADPREAPAGALFGWSGSLYACDRGARLLGDPSLRLDVAVFLRAMNQLGHGQLRRLLVRGGARDVGTGAAGLLLVALATSGALDDDRLAVASVAARLLQARVPRRARDAPLYPPHAWSPGVVGMTAGIQLALARWHARPESRVDDRIPPASKWPDGELRPADLLALLAVARLEPTLESLALRQADAHLRSRPADGDGLGWLERGTIALAAQQVARRQAEAGNIYLDAALHAGERLHALKEHTGRWLPELLLTDRYNPSAFMGLSAIAHFFLDLASGGGLPSHRVLE